MERAYEYSQEKEMLDKWHFLTGSEEELRPIWRSYWLDPVSTNAARGGHETDEDRLSDGTESEAPPPLGGYLISHGAPVFLIDAQGKRRVLFTNLSLLPRSLVHDVRLLLR